MNGYMNLRRRTVCGATFAAVAGGAATANDATVELKPFYDTHHEHYTVYFNADGRAVKWHRILNRNSQKVLAVDGMSTDNSAHVVQRDFTGTDDQLWKLL